MLNLSDLSDLLPNDFLARKEFWDVITNLVSVIRTALHNFLLNLYYQLLKLKFIILLINLLLL